MPKLGMEPVRRRQIIDATMACIHAQGIAKTTLQRIARRAGVAPGLILHYFDGKDGLLEAVYRDLYKRLGEETLGRLKRAETPTERLLAILDAQVCEAMIEPRTVATWFALGAKAPDTPGLARMERINAKRLMSNLVHDLKSVGATSEEAVDIAEELLAMIYGLWVNLANQTLASPGQARTILFRFLRARVPQLAA